MYLTHLTSKRLVLAGAAALALAAQACGSHGGSTSTTSGGTGAGGHQATTSSSSGHTSTGTGGAPCVATDAACVACGSTTCGFGEGCCTTAGVSTCKAAGSCSSPEEVDCDGPEDCLGMVCCVNELVKADGTVQQIQATCDVMCVSRNDSTDPALIVSPACRTSADCAGAVDTFDQPYPHCCVVSGDSPSVCLTDTYAGFYPDCN